MKKFSSKHMLQHVSRHIQANRWGEHSQVGENIAWEDIKKLRDQKKAKFRKTLKNLPRYPSKEAIFKFSAL